MDTVNAVTKQIILQNNNRREHNILTVTFLKKKTVKLC